MRGQKIVAGLLAAVIFGYGVYVGYNEAELKETTGKPVPTDPGKEHPKPEPTKPEPTPTKPDEPAKTPDKADPQQPAPTTPPPAQTGAVITVQAFQGSGSLPLTDKGLKNSAFDIERIDWSEANRTIVIVGKMRVFEAVGYMRARDESKQIIEPERVIRANEGAPAWSPIEGQIPLLNEYKGKTLIVEFYEKSAKDGSNIHILPIRIKLE